MKKSLFVIAIAISLTLISWIGATVQAGVISPKLQNTLDTAAADELVPVIIRLTKPIALKDYKDPDKSLRRSKLIKGLKAKTDLNTRSLKQFLKNNGIKAKDITVLWNINAVALKVPANLVDRLTARTDIERVSLDRVVMAGIPATCGFSSPAGWNLDAVQASSLWSLGYDGTGAVVATMDSGVDPDHPDIGPRWRGGSNSWFDPHGQHATPYDADGHGTYAMGLMVGGNAGGSAIGVAPGAQWIAAKIFDDSGQAALSDIHLGFQWILDPDGNPDNDDAPDVLNSSWYLQDTVNQCDTEFASDIALLKAAEIAVVFAAGNTGPNPSSSVSPSNDPQSLAVGSVAEYSGIYYVSGSSARGPSACGGGFFPQLAAPGSDVVTADLTLGGTFPDSYTCVSGTSFAAPHVSGAMAVLKSAMDSQGTPVTVAQLESAVLEGAVDMGATGPDNEWGEGLLDMSAAYDWLLANAGSPQPGDLQFSAATYSVAENGGSILVTVTRTGGSAGTVSVDYTTIDGTATAGQDYQSTSGTLTFLDGETQQTFSVTILDDTLFEGDETLTLSLSNTTGGAALGSPDSAVLTIVEDDALPQPGDLQFSAADYNVNENAGSITITVTRTGGSDGTVSIDYATVDGTATAGDDYTAASGTLTFADGDISESFTLSILDDTLDEGDENLSLTLSNPTGGATLGSPATSAVTIVDDDAVTSTIAITRARFLVSKDKLIVWATSDLGSQAALQMTVDLAAGGSLTKNMNWNASKNRWQKALGKFVSKYGSQPTQVTVFGPEGSESSPVEVR